MTIRSTPSSIIVPQDGFGRLHAGAEERERRLEQDRVRDEQREEDEHRRGDVRHDLAEHDPQRAHALGAGGLDELLLAQRQHLAAHRPRQVGDVDERDHEGRDREAVRPAIVIGPSLSPPSASDVPSAIPSRITGNAQRMSRTREMTCRSSRGSSRRARRRGSPKSVVISAALIADHAASCARRRAAGP